jgi:protein SCO1/2
VRSAAEKYFSDVELINQDGQKMRFYRDVLKDKVVVINTFFTTCTGVCPPINRNLEKVQEALGDRLGKDAFLISMSVDPETDTPSRLKEYSRRFRARPGWIFLTGKKENVDWALYKLGQYVETKEGHTNIIIIGNEPKGLWKKAFGLAKADELIKMVEDVISDR